MARARAILLSLCVVGLVLVPGGAATAAPTPTPTVHAGDLTTCEAAGLAGAILATREAIGPDLLDAGEPGASVDVDQLGSADEKYRKLTEVRVNDGYFMTGVVVVGGGSSHVYNTSVPAVIIGPDTLTDLVAPPVSGTPPQISRYLVCGGFDLTPDPETRTGSVTTCEAAGLSGSIVVEGARADAATAAPDAGDSATGLTADVLHDGPLQGRTMVVRTNSEFTISGIVVAGLGAYNVYAGPFSGPIVVSELVAPPPAAEPPIIERYFVCGPYNPALPDTGNTPSSSAMIWLVTGGVALVIGGATLLMVLRRRRISAGRA